MMAEIDMQVRISFLSMQMIVQAAPQVNLKTEVKQFVIASHIVTSSKSASPVAYFSSLFKWRKQPSLSW